MSKDARIGLTLPAEELEELDAVAEVEFRSRPWIARWALKIGLDYIRQHEKESWWNEWSSKPAPAQPEGGRLIPFRRDLAK